MNWQTVRQITHVEIGRFLALMLVAWSPFTGGPRLPSLLLHPLKATQTDDSHFEPESDEYLNALIIEDRKRVLQGIFGDGK